MSEKITSKEQVEMAMKHGTLDDVFDIIKKEIVQCDLISNGQNSFHFLRSTCVNPILTGWTVDSR